MARYSIYVRPDLLQHSLWSPAGVYIDGMEPPGADPKKGGVSKWVTMPEGWMGAESEQLSPLTLLLVLIGPGFFAFILVQALFGTWAGLVAFLILELGVLALVRRDYARKKVEEGPQADTPSKGANDRETDKDHGPHD